MPTLDDDLDWLYRRGRYAQDATGSQPRISAPLGGDTGRQHPVARTAADQRRPQPAPRPEPVPHRQAPTQQPRPTGLGAPSTKPVTFGRRAGGATPAPGGRRRRRPARWIAALLVAFLVYLLAVPALAWAGLQHVAYAPDAERPAGQPGTLLLLAGSDSRDGLTSQQMHDLGTGSEGGNVADTIMLLYLPPSGRPALISVPRDSYVTIPGHGKNKINAAFALGGPKLLTQTIERNTDLRVDGYLGIGFGGFVSIIDALGGIEQCPATDINDDGAHLNIKKGCQNMDGVTALKYVRYRHADPLGDIGRANRQRAMVAAVAKKAASPLSVINPITYIGLNRSGAAALKAGDGTGVTQIAPAAWAFLSISRGNGLTLSVPVGDVDLRTSGGGSAVAWDKKKSAELFEQIAAGDTSQLDKFAKK